MRTSNILIIIATIGAILCYQVEKKAYGEIKVAPILLKGNGNIISKNYGKMTATTLFLSTRFEFMLDPNSTEIEIIGDKNLLDRIPHLKHENVLNFAKLLHGSSFNSKTIGHSSLKDYDAIVPSQAIQITLGVKHHKKLTLLSDHNTYIGTFRPNPHIRTLDTLHVDNLNIHLDGICTAEMLIMSKSISLSNNGGSDIELSGTTDQLFINTQGTSSILAKELKTTDTYLMVSNNSTVQINSDSSVDGIVKYSRVVNYSSVKSNTLVTLFSDYTEL